MFEFKVNLVDDDFILFNQYHLLNSPNGKKSLLYFKYIIPFICFIFVLIFFIAGADTQLVLIQAIVMTIFSIFWIGFSKKMILKSMKKNLIKMKKDGRLPYSNEATIKFDEASIYEITPNTENRTNYSLIEKIAVTEQAIYFYFSSVQAYIIPMTVFSGEIEKQKFLEFINLKADNLRDKK